MLQNRRNEKRNLFLGMPCFLIWLPVLFTCLFYSCEAWYYFSGSESMSFTKLLRMIDLSFSRAQYNGPAFFGLCSPHHKEVRAVHYQAPGFFFFFSHCSKDPIFILRYPVLSFSILGERNLEMRFIFASLFILIRVFTFSVT